MRKLWTGHNEHFSQTQGGNYFYSIYLNRETKNRTSSAATQNGSLSVYAIKPKGALECTRVSDDILRWILTVVVHTGTLSEAPSEGILTWEALKRDCCIRRESSVVGAHKQESPLLRHEDERSRSHEGICAAAEMLHPPGWLCSSDAVTAQKCSHAVSEPSSLTLFRMGWNPVLSLRSRSGRGGDMKETVQRRRGQNV